MVVERWSRRVGHYLGFAVTLTTSRLAEQCHTLSARLPRRPALRWDVIQVVSRGESLPVRPGVEDLVGPCAWLLQRITNPS